MRTHMTQISPVRALLPGKAMSQPDDGTQFRGQKGGISDSSTLFPAPGRPSCRLFRLAKLDFAKSLAVHWTTRNPLDHKESTGPQGLKRPASPHSSAPKTSFCHSSCCTAPVFQRRAPSPLTPDSFPVRARWPQSGRSLPGLLRRRRDASFFGGRPSW